MLIASNKRWRQAPFSYTKFCDAVSVWFGLITGFGVFLVIRVLPLPQLGGWYTLEVIAVISWLIIYIAFQRTLKVFLWNRLPSDLKQDFAYDSATASSSEYPIKNYRDLWRWIVTRPRRGR